MAAYCAASSSWRSAKPTVRNSAKISNPSKVQPRFEAISTFHCARLSERYHGRRRADSWIDIDAPSPVHPRPSQREAIGRFQREYRERRRSAATDAKRLSRSPRLSNLKQDPGESRDAFGGCSCVGGNGSRPSPGPKEGAP